MKTEAWWTCSCWAKVYRVGKGRGQAWDRHVKTCSAAKKGMRIVQHPQEAEKRDLEPCEHGRRSPCPTCDPYVYAREQEKLK